MIQLSLKVFILPGLFFSSSILLTWGVSLEEITPIQEAIITEQRSFFPIDKKSTSLEAAPEDILQYMRSYLPDSDAANLRQVSKLFRDNISRARIRACIPSFNSPLVVKSMLSEALVFNMEGAGENALDPYEKLKNFIAFKVPKESEVHDIILESILTELRFKDKKIFNKVKAYMMSTSGSCVSPIKGLEVFKEQYPENPIFLKDVCEKKLVLPHAINITEEDLRSSKLYRILEGNPNHQIILKISRENSCLMNKEGKLKLPDNDYIFDLIKHLTILGHENITSIADGFLVGCHNLQSLNLRALSNVVSIGDYFLTNCIILTSIDLGSLLNVNSIGDNFMEDCRRLKSLDLSSLSKVESIGDNFLIGCRGLTSLDLGFIANVRSIKNDFLNGCTNLTFIDLSPLSKIVSIGDGFLLDCTNLTSIDLRPLSRVSYIGLFFLSRCTQLSSLDLSPLSNINSIGNGFLWNCPAYLLINFDKFSITTFLNVILPVLKFRDSLLMCGELLLYLINHLPEGLVGVLHSPRNIDN